MPLSVAFLKSICAAAGAGRLLPLLLGNGLDITQSALARANVCRIYANCYNCSTGTDM